ncbi:MAG: hypothetical protein ACYCX4_05220 [Bacillota bacterium]
MIKAYLAGISSQYEGEDIEVQYCIYEDQELLCKKYILMEYMKPAIVAQVALITLLKELEKYIGKEIAIIINDAALYEIVRGTSTTKNMDVLKMAVGLRKKLTKFGDCVIKDVSGDRVELAKWKEVLQH